MDPLSVTASIFSVLQLSGIVFVNLSNIKNASKEREKCAIEVGNLQNLLLKLKIRLEEESHDTPWYTEVQALAEEDGPLDQFKQGLRELQDKITDGGRLKKVGEALVWKFKREDIERILAQMESLKALIAIALQMDHFKLPRAIKDDTDYIRARIIRVSSGFDTLRQDHDRVKHDMLIAWLSQTDYPTQHSDIIRRRQEGTGQWFLDAREFKTWLTEPKETLFCAGIPGAGKTMIAAIAIEHLADIASSNTVGLAYLYCNYKAQGEQKVTGLLAAILKQVVQAHPKLIDPVEDLHHKHAKKKTQPSTDEIARVLQAILARLQTVYIVVDALDECPNDDNTRRQLLSQLRALQKKTDLRLMVTSRDIPDIAEEFKENLKLEVEARDEDVKLYVAGQIDRLPQCVRRDAELKQMVQDKVTKAVDGMFLLARLHVDSLLDKRTKSKVLSTLNALSKGSQALNKAYQDAIERIKSQMPEDTKLATKVLSWITYAQRALTTTELCHALAVEEESTDLDQDNILGIEDVLSVCAGLVNVDEKSNIIRLVHYTTQEYFETIRDEWNPKGQLDITLTCLRYLSFDTFKIGSCATDGEFESRLKQNAFLGYAARYWGLHAGSVQEDIADLACTVLHHDRTVSSIVQVASAPPTKYEGYSQGFPKGRTGLHIAARFGLYHVYQQFLEEIGGDPGASADKKDSEGHTPLHLAAQYGKAYMVKLLLAHGANANVQGGFFGNALQAASVASSEQIVQELLEKDADVSSLAGFYGHALQGAARVGNAQIVNLLIERGADVNAKGGCYGTALQAACVMESERVVKLLLDNDADVNVYGGYYNDALQAASIAGNEQIVKLLLEKDADVAVTGGRYNSALWAASLKGNQQIVAWLLARGADTSVTSEDGWTPLTSAASNGHTEVVQLLLDNGADMTVTSNKGRTPLALAAWNGYMKTVQLLLDRGANMATASEDGWTALTLASTNGHTDIVQQLLDKGANMTATSKNGRTPLNAASDVDSHDVCKLLLERGAYTENKGLDAYYGTIVNLLAYKGYLDLIRLIYEQYSADLFLDDAQRRLALHFAAKCGHMETLQYLIDKGLDPNSVDAKGDDVLCYASSGGSIEIVKVALQNGFKSSTGYTHWTPLHWACRSGNMEVVELLLKEGFQSQLVTLPEPEGDWTPLDIALFHGHKNILEQWPPNFTSEMDIHANTLRQPAKSHGGYRCDGCMHEIYGSRYHCFSCGSVDFCFMCKPFLEYLHDDHQWKYYESHDESG